MSERRALVFGGTGVIGSEVLRELRRAGITATFTYWSAESLAISLGLELAHRAVRVDLRDGAAISDLISGLGCFDIFVHCAGKSSVQPLLDIADADWDELEAINVRSAFIAVRELVRIKAADAPLEIILIAALDAIRHTDSPPHFGATQGALLGLTRTLAKCLGPLCVRTNLVVLGPVGAGISAQFSEERRDSYLRNSALGRLASPAEAARSVRWLATENSYINGAVVPLTGGI
jgi:3-oxoacyl-[acyl-carrier protein] reductase